MKRAVFIILAVIFGITALILCVVDIDDHTIYRHEGLELFTDTQMEQFKTDLLDHAIMNSVVVGDNNPYTIEAINHSGNTLVKYKFYADVELSYGKVKAITSDSTAVVCLIVIFTAITAIFIILAVLWDEL